MNFSNTATSPEVPVTTPRRIAREAMEIAIAAFGLVAISTLALLPAVTATTADKLTLLFLAVVAVVCFWTPLLRYFEIHSGAAAFALTAAMFIVYSLARAAGPKEGLSLRVTDDMFPVSYAARIVVLCAIVTIPAWWRSLNGWTKSLLCGALVIAVLAAFSFGFLSRYYPVGVTEVLDPTPLPHLAMQLIEYSALALLCNVITAHPVTRRVVLRVLPLLLFALWARHQFIAVPPEATAVEEAA